MKTLKITLVSSRQHSDLGSFKRWQKGALDAKRAFKCGFALMVLQLWIRVKKIEKDKTNESVTHDVGEQIEHSSLVILIGFSFELWWKRDGGVSNSSKSFRSLLSFFAVGCLFSLLKQKYCCLSSQKLLSASS